MRVLSALLVVASMTSMVACDKKSPTADDKDEKGGKGKGSSSEKKCDDKDDMAACVQAGKDAYEGDADYDKAKKYLKKACDGGEARGCELLGGLYLLGKGVKKDEDKALELFEKACEGDDAHGCEAAGKMHRDKRGAAADPSKATKLLTKACDGKAYGACASLALDAMKNGDKEKGVELMTKSCDGGDKLGCMGLGALYLHGNGVKKDVEKAKSLLHKACKLGEQSACKKVKELD